MKKLIRDGKVAVIYSPGFGGGWYTWHGIKDLIFDPTVVEMIEANTPVDSIVSYCEETYGKHYYGGVTDLRIEWIKQGSLFRINEYDGSEEVTELHNLNLLQA